MDKQKWLDLMRVLMQPGHTVSINIHRLSHETEKELIRIFESDPRVRSEGSTYWKEWTMLLGRVN